MDLDNLDFSDENTGLDFSRWVEQTTAVPEPLTLETKSIDNAVFVIQDRFKYKPIPRWNDCVKPFLDERAPFDGKYVICYLSTAGGLKGPKKNADYINARFCRINLISQNITARFMSIFPQASLQQKLFLTILLT